MDVGNFVEFTKLRYVQHTTDIYSDFKRATALNMEKAASIIIHFLEVMAIMGIPLQIKTNNALSHVSKKKNFFACSNLKHITDIPHDPTSQVVVEKSNQTLKDILNKQK